MSSRQLRKIRQQQELLQLQNEQTGSEEQSEDDEPERAPTKPRASLFAALGDNDDDENSDEADKEPEPVDKDVVHEDESAQQVPSSKKNKKKKKKKAKKATAVADNLPQTAEDEADEIDKAIRELNITGDARASTSSHQDNLDQKSREVDELLQINAHHLKAIHEMRSLFGKEAIETAHQEEQADQEAARRRQRGPAQQQVDLETALKGDPRKKLPEISLRRNIFVQGRDVWPRATAAGLVMKEISRNSDGSTEYAFDHEKDYDAAQHLFFSCVQIGDPMRMVSLLREYPYHISTLLQVSKVAIQDQNASLGADLCERALFTFGRVTTASFRQKLEQGKARLDFRRPENREFWLAGYQYLKSLVRKGTYRTALEWSKLLFSLDPKDPYAMKHFIHVLAIRARQAQWLIDFYSPTAFGSDKDDDVYIKQTLVLAKLQLGDADGAKTALVEGMERLPWLYCALFQAIDLEAPPPLWGVQPDTDSRDFWTNMYIHEAKDIWNNTQATVALKEAAKLAKKVTPSSLPRDNPADLRTARLVFLDGNTKLISGVPRAILAQQPNYEFDPLPPPKQENIFSSRGTMLPWAAGDGHDQSLRGLPAMQALLNRILQTAEREGQPEDAAAGLNNIVARDTVDDDENSDVAEDEVDDEHAESIIPGMLRQLRDFLGLSLPGFGGGAAPQDQDSDDTPREPAPLEDGDSDDAVRPPGDFPSDDDSD